MSASSEPGSLAFHNQGHALYIGGNQTAQGNINYYYNGEGPQQDRPVNTGPNYSFGLSLDGAPQIADDLFVGRERELVQMQELLSPITRVQNVVAVSGLGGMGKTQLCIHYAKQHRETYSSIFWLNAKDESTLTAGIYNLVMRVADGSSSLYTSHLNPDEAVKWFQSWLSKSENNRWLVIFDNYDDPDMPGMRSATGYDLRRFFPPRQQGFILITTRVTRLSFATQLKLCKLEKPRESLMILANRSGRKTESDPHAKDLALRLDGLPLALATAGSYLSQTTSTFGDYLQLYEDKLEELEQNSEGLLEYDDRRLWTTWAISLKQIESHDPEAVKLMQLLAYFDNQHIWYGLLRPGGDCGLSWLSDVVRNEIRFNRAMAKLHDYSLIDIRPDSYSIHACVHDWALGFLNRNLDFALHGVAMHCVGVEAMLPGNYIRNRRLLQHANRLQSGRLKIMMDSNMANMHDLIHIAILYNQLGELSKAEPIYLRLLQMTQQNESISTQENMLMWELLCELGGIYASQERFAEAEELLLNALAELKKLHGLEDLTTIGILHKLGALYLAQGKLDAGEKIILQELAGTEQICGSEHHTTLRALHLLGHCYMNQGKMAGAESILLRALTGFEKVCGLEDESTLSVVWLLAELYVDQEKIAEAVELSQRGIKGLEKIRGSATLGMARELAASFGKKGMLVEAEQMYLRALAAYEKMLGPEHELTVETAYELECFQRHMKYCVPVSSLSDSTNSTSASDIDNGWEHHMTLDSLQDTMMGSTSEAITARRNSPPLGSPSAPIVVDGDSDGDDGYGKATEQRRKRRKLQ
ncbi:hypothetical protein EPUS_08636 [Endocarpon pusillum Z07020]|uniref:Uncharacterized protein n=1 Tax=Endocarpon pusillum (strain Z07020 / HMAS-L-300199) TaxID=1263415 RepID=U1HGT5_ENDPU|nr:uncharacterized protein EPUS_08636 [Endocarpon pusillum Z07020]ERF69365.1 hypothetical protein EPUS_08636 [Endocarpon pusillum Z07020]